MPADKKCPCGGTAVFSRHCGAYIFDRCDAHLGLVRCYCGWTQSGRGDGRQELIEMGETIDPEDY